MAASSKLVDLAGMSGEDESNDRKQIWLIRPNCLVRKDTVASGMTQNSCPYICSKSCMPMFNTAAILEESVIVACALFLPPVFDDSDMA
jgi:tRNA(Ile)-lysidine synthase TilS/MesJ